MLGLNEKLRRAIVLGSLTLTPAANGRAVESTFDGAGNRAELQYPSGLKIGTDFDLLNRPRSMFRMGL